MSQLLDIQPEDREPVDYTHFDCWFEVPAQFEGEDGAGMAEFENADIEQRAEKLTEILNNWEKSLEMSFGFLDDFSGQGYGPATERAAYAMGWDNLLDLIVFNILRAGYDVYIGSDFIEIYKREA